MKLLLICSLFEKHIKMQYLCVAIIGSERAKAKLLLWGSFNPFVKCCKIAALHHNGSWLLYEFQRDCVLCQINDLGLSRVQ